MEFLEASAFTRRLADYLTDDDYRELQRALSLNPVLGDLIPGTGGFRKMRWADLLRGKGRRGGLRVIYYYFLSSNQIWFMTIYGKNEATDLTADEKRTLKAAVEAELKARKASKEGKR